MGILKTAKFKSEHFVYALALFSFMSAAESFAESVVTGSRVQQYPWRVAEKEKQPAQANLYKEGTQNYAFQAVYLLKKIQLLDPADKSKSEVKAMIQRNQLEKFCSKKNDELDKNPKKCINDYRDTLAAQVKDVERKLEKNKLQIGELEDDQVDLQYKLPKVMRRQAGSRARVLPIIEVSFEKGKKGKTQTKVRVPYVPTVSDLSKAQKNQVPFVQKSVKLDRQNRLVSGEDRYRSKNLEVLAGTEFNEFAANFPKPPRLEDYRRYRRIPMDPNDPNGKSYLEAVKCSDDETCYDMVKYQEDFKLYNAKFKDARAKYLEMVSDSNRNRNFQVLKQGERRYAIDGLYRDRSGRPRENFKDLPETYQALLAARASLIKAGNEAVTKDLPTRSPDGKSLTQGKLSADSILEKVKLDQALSKQELKFLQAEFRRMGESQVRDPGQYISDSSDRKNIYLTLEPEDIRKALKAIYAEPAPKKAPSSVATDQSNGGKSK